MSLWVKRVLWVLSGVIGLFVALIFSADFLLERRLQSVLNSNPSRQYDISFEDLQIHNFFKGVELTKVTIEPVLPDSTPVAVYGRLDHARIRGLVWARLFLEGTLSLDEIRFIEPVFRVYRKTRRDTVQKKTASNGKGVQVFFQDLLSRGRLSRFKISGGEAYYYLFDQDSLEYARAHNIQLSAENIETDKIKLKYPIPFEMERFTFSLDSLHFRPSSDIEIQTDFLGYSSDKNSFALYGASMKYTRPWIEISREIGEQKDLIELEMDTLQIQGIKPLSQLFGNLDMRADKIRIAGLSFYDYKNLNLPLLQEDYKPMFLGMINRIPFSIELDSLQIRDSHVEYFEVSPNRSKAGVIIFDSFSADVYHISNQKDYRDKHKRISAEFLTKFNGEGEIQASLVVPYEKEFFHLKAEMDRMPLSALNKTLVPLAGVRITDGLIHHLTLDMAADSTFSTNRLELDYENIGFMVLDRKNEWKPRDRSLLSSLAKMAIHKTNLPDQKKYRTAHFTANRISHKSPFNFMWVSLKEGCTYIIPGKLAGRFIKHEGEELK